MHVFVGLRSALGSREGQLWFAGEAVHENSLKSSTVHGAWLSGVKAAVEVSQSLNIPITLPTKLTAK